MMVRDYCRGDRAALDAMHAAKNLACRMPDLDDPRLWITRKVMVDDQDRPQCAVALRFSSEGFYWSVPNGALPFTRMKRFLTLQEVAYNAGKNVGLDCVGALIPPDLESTYGVQLERLGWMRLTWPSYMRWCWEKTNGIG